METPLDPVEARVLASLIEKAIDHAGVLPAHPPRPHGRV